jgi:thiol-disulfide isomerase/thioredoxin
MNEQIKCTASLIGRYIIGWVLLYIVSHPCAAFRSSTGSGTGSIPIKTVISKSFGMPSISTFQIQIPRDPKKSHLQLSEQKSTDVVEGIGKNTSSILPPNHSNVLSKEHSNLQQSQQQEQPSTLGLISTPQSTVNASSPASFGDVVSLKQRPMPISTGSLSKDVTTNQTPSFGDVVPLRKNVAVQATISEERQLANQIRFRNTVVAILSIAVAIGNFVYQYLHPIEPIQVLFDLQQSSADISVVGKNHKPTIIDFWAPWCENCKLSAATLQSIEKQYENDVNFILINGDLASSWPYIEALGVDAIPHMAMISYDGVVETSLIGPIPKHIIQEDIDVLLLNSRNNAEAIRTTTVGSDPNDSRENLDKLNQPQQPEHIDLPHKMLDVFAGKPDSARRVQF